MDLDLKVTGLSEVRQSAERGRRLLDAGQDLVMRDLAQMWRDGEANIFATEGGSLNRKWPSLKPSTVKSRAYLIKRFGIQVRPDGPILQQYGDLLDALKFKGGAQEQVVSGGTVRITIDGGRINRHDRTKGLGLTLTARGQRRRPTGKAAKRYPDDIIGIHEKTRPMVGIPVHIQMRQEERVKSFLDNVAAQMNGAPVEGAGA